MSQPVNSSPRHGLLESTQISISGLPKPATGLRPVVTIGHVEIQLLAEHVLPVANSSREFSLKLTGKGFEFCSKILFTLASSRANISSNATAREVHSKHRFGVL